ASFTYLIGMLLVLFDASLGKSKEKKLLVLMACVFLTGVSFMYNLTYPVALAGLALYLLPNFKHYLAALLKLDLITCTSLFFFVFSSVSMLLYFKYIDIGTGAKLNLDSITVAYNNLL